MSISLKELKKNRMTPAEKWVLEQIEGCKPETNSDGDVYLYNNEKVLLYQSPKFLYVYHVFWYTLIDKFCLTYGESEELLTNLLYDYTDNGKLKVVLIPV